MVIFFPNRYPQTNAPSNNLLSQSHIHNTQNTLIPKIWRHPIPAHPIPPVLFHRWLRLLAGGRGQRDANRRYQSLRHQSAQTGWELRVPTRFLLRKLFFRVLKRKRKRHPHHHHNPLYYHQQQQQQQSFRRQSRSLLHVA